MAMAFNERGQKSVSLTGDQAGITTSDSFNKGRILGVDPNRVFEALDAGNIVVVAGFQGITAVSYTHLLTFVVQSCIIDT